MTDFNTTTPDQLAPAPAASAAATAATASTASSIRSDLLAGITVFLIALPLCLGIAAASGVKPFAGILAGVIGGLVVALLSGSRLSVSGPAAGLVVIVVQALATLGSFSAFLTALVLAGLLQCAAGLLRAGRLASYVPIPVINGMLASIGILLILNQLPTAIGLVDGLISFEVAVLALVSLGLLIAWDSQALRRLRVVRAIPGPLAVVLLGIAVTTATAWLAPGAMPSLQTVSMPPLGSWDALGAAFTFPDLTQWSNPAVWRVAAIIAIVASLETLLSLEALEQLDPAHRKTPPNRELLAQGVGNTLGGLLGALPITAVVVRSATNLHAGARSRLACMTHGTILLVATLALTGVISLIPLASLAAILIYTGYKLAKPQLFISMGRAGYAQLVPFVGTIAGVLLTDLLIGIAIGFALSIVLMIERNTRRVLTFTRHGNYHLLTIRKSASFLCTPQLKSYLEQIPPGATLILDATRADHIDHDIHEVIGQFALRAQENGVRMEYKDWPVE